MDKLLAFTLFGLFVVAVVAFFLTLMKKDVGTPKKEEDKEVFNYKDWMVSDKPGVKKNGR